MYKATNNKQRKAAIACWKLQEPMRIKKMNRLGKRKIYSSIFSGTNICFYSDIHSAYIRTARSLIKEYNKHYDLKVKAY